MLQAAKTACILMQLHQAGPSCTLGLESAEEARHWQETDEKQAIKIVAVNAPNEC